MLPYFAAKSPESRMRLLALVEKATVTRDNVEAFLALEFGEDFGEILLCCAENVPEYEFGIMVEKILSIRQQADEYAKPYARFSPELGVAVQRAVGERITENLYVAEEIATSPNHIATARVQGKRISVTGYSEIIDALNLIDIGLIKYNNAYKSGVTSVAYSSESSIGVYVGENKDVLRQFKPYGSQNGSHMRGVEHSEEA